MKESLRGLLLSVLFFALLIGSAPTAVAGDGLASVRSAHISPGTCAQHGGTWVLPKDRTANPQGYCTYEDTRVDLSGLPCSMAEGMGDWAGGWIGTAFGMAPIPGGQPGAIVLGGGGSLLAFTSWMMKGAFC